MKTELKQNNLKGCLFSSINTVTRACDLGNNFTEENLGHKKS